MFLVDCRLHRRLCALVLGVLLGLVSVPCLDAFRLKLCLL